MLQEKFESTEVPPQQPLPPYTSAMEVPAKFLSPQYYLASRPQYLRSCGMSSLVSIFNLHFSTLGNGKLHPLTVEEAYRKLNVIGTGSKGEQFKSGSTEGPAESNNLPLHQYMNSLDFGYFTYNETLVTWFKLLCRMYGVKGRASIFYKKSGQGKTSITEEQAKTKLVQGLVKGNTAFIYHAYDHYFSPVGYELIPKDGSDTQGGPCSSTLQSCDLWVMISETAARYAPLRIVRWSQVQLDLSTCYPQRYDIRNPQKGIFNKPGCEDDKPGATFHCIMSFEKLG